jgi:branched-chain amino acid transport system permease protein
MGVAGAGHRRRTLVLRGIGLVLLAALPFAAPPSWTVRATLVGLTAIGVLGQGLLMGQAGLVSFGQAGFLAIGAVTFAHLRLAGVPSLIAVVAGGLAAAGGGVLLGLPALRLKGPYLAVATLGFGVAVYQALVSFEGLSGGRTGLDVPRLDPWFGLSRDATVYYLSLVVLLAFLAVTRNLVSSWVGRAFAAIRDSEVAAEAAGIRLARYKLLAFALSSFYTGVEGALFAQFLGHLEPQNFTIAESITLFVGAVVGGLASVEGAVLGAAFVVLLPSLADSSGFLVPVAYGLSLIAVMLLEPEGLAGGLARIRVTFAGRPVS